MAEIDGLRFQMKRLDNDTFYATLMQDSQHHALVRHYHTEQNYDDVGALYYVIAVVLIYGLSIVMMIASHIKKNKMDSHISIYLKEIAFVRKQSRREQLMVKVSSPSPSQERAQGKDTENGDSFSSQQQDNISFTSNVPDSETPLYGTPSFGTPGSAASTSKSPEGAPNTKFPFNTPPSTHVHFEDERQRLLVPRTPSPVSRTRVQRSHPNTPSPPNIKRDRNRLSAANRDRRRSIAEKRDALAPLILKNPKINIENSSDDSECGSDLRRE